MMLEPVLFLFSDSTNAYLQSLGNPFIDLLFKGITDAGSQPAYFFIASIIFWCFSKRTGIRTMYVILFSTLFAILAKDMLGMPRPPVSLHKVSVTGFGFPSGHAQVSAGFWAYLGSRTENQRIILAGTAAVSLVSLSRVYLGVHYVGDVIGGILFGSIIALVSFRAESWILDRLQGNIKYLAAATPFVIVAAIASTQAFSAEQAEQIETGLVMASTGIGYILEEKLIRLEDAKNNKQRVKRAFTGTLVSLVIYMLFYLISSLVLYNFVLFEYAALGMASTFIAPWIFVRVEPRSGTE